MLAILKRPFLDYMNKLEENDIDDMIEIVINYVDFVEFGKHDVMFTPSHNQDEEQT